MFISIVQLGKLRHAGPHDWPTVTAGKSNSGFPQAEAPLGLSLSLGLGAGTPSVGGPDCAPWGCTKASLRSALRWLLPVSLPPPAPGPGRAPPAAGKPGARVGQDQEGGARHQQLGVEGRSRRRRLSVRRGAEREPGERVPQPGCRETGPGPGPSPSPSEPGARGRRRRPVSPAAAECNRLPDPCAERGGEGKTPAFHRLGLVPAGWAQGSRFPPKPLPRLRLDPVPLVLL